MANDGRSLREAFETDGVVRVPAAVARHDVAAMQACVWDLFAAHGLVRDEPDTWAPGGGLRLVELIGALRPGPGTDALLWEVGRAAPFAPLAAALGQAVDHALGAGIWAPVDDQHGGLAAPNFPISAPAWNVPHEAWHVDEPTAAVSSGWGVLGFAFLDEVEPAGGATVVISGSHRRLGKLAAGSAGLVTTDEAIAALRRDDPWFADLFSPGAPDQRRRRFMRDGHVSMGVALRVVELTGAPGDLVLMDPRCLHTVSANVSHRARLTMRLVCGRRGA